MIYYINFGRRFYCTFSSVFRTEDPRRWASDTPTHSLFGSYAYYKDIDKYRIWETDISL